MQAKSRFVRTTILGGVLFPTPIVVVWLILSKTYDVAGRVLQPLTALKTLLANDNHPCPRSPFDRARLLSPGGFGRRKS